MSNEPITTRPGDENPIYLRLAKEFESAAETYREVRLYGKAFDAEAKKGVCEYLIAARPER